MYINEFKLPIKTLSMQSGIVSFKNLQEGFMPFNKGLLSEETINSFVLELDRLILEIFDTDIPFQEKELVIFNK